MPQEEEKEFHVPPGMIDGGVFHVTRRVEACMDFATGEIRVRETPLDEASPHQGS